MTSLYNLFIRLYFFAAWLISPFHAKARAFHSGRKSWQNNMKQQLVPGTRYVWFHCASLGEFEQGRPVIEAFHNRYPQLKIVITFFSPSGYEIRKNYSQAAAILYLPADTRLNAIQFMDLLHPELAFFIKYEFWYHYLDVLRQRAIPHYLISGIFRPEQPFFSEKPWGSWFRKMLKGYSHIFVQDKQSADLLIKAGIENITLSGDTRFDRVAEIANSSKPVDLVDKFAGNETVIIAGSTWKEDEELITAYILSHAKIKWIIAPHEVGRDHVEKLQNKLKNRAITLSDAETVNPATFQVLIIDSIGKLSSIYRYGQMAYIGGGFGKGIHNILEAATYGLPVMFGPNYNKFKEARDLVTEGAAVSVSDAGKLALTINHLLTEPEERIKLGLIAKNYVANNKGATEKILSHIIVR